MQVTQMIDITMDELGINSDEFAMPRSQRMLKILHNILFCKHLDICVSGPVGTGKTRVIWWALNLLCQLAPDVRLAIVRNEKSTIYTSIHQTIGDMMIHNFTKSPRSPFHPIGGEVFTKRLLYHSGSEVYFGGMDDKEKVLGFEPNIVFWNQSERAAEPDYNQLNGRLRGKGGFTNPFTGKKTTLFLSDANPAGPKHFLRNRMNRGALKMFATTLEDNQGYFQDGEWTDAGLMYKERLDIAYPYDGVERDRMVHGKWVGAEGLIYPQFNEAVHVRPIRLGDVPSDWRWQGSVDYGKTHPAAYGLHAISPDYKTNWVFKQILQTGYTASALVEPIRALNAKYGVPERVRIVGDCASDHNETLQDAGLNVVDARKEVLFGIDIVRQWFSGAHGKEIVINEDVLDHRPDPTLVDAGRPINLIDELFEYAHLPEDKQTTGTEKDDHPDKKKGSDDSCDMLRYQLVDITPTPSNYVPIGRGYKPTKLPEYTGAMG